MWLGLPDAKQVKSTSTNSQKRTTFQMPSPRLPQSLLAIRTPQATPIEPTQGNENVPVPRRE